MTAMTGVGGGDRRAIRGFALHLTPCDDKIRKNLKELDGPMRTWPLQEARTHLRDVVDAAIQQGPQRITRHGRDAVVVVSEDKWNRRNEDKPSFGALLADTPFTSRERPPRRTAAAIRAAHCSNRTERRCIRSIPTYFRT